MISQNDNETREYLSIDFLLHKEKEKWTQLMGNMNTVNEEYKTRGKCYQLHLDVHESPGKWAIK